MRNPDRLIIDRSPGEIRIAALADDVLTDIWVERPDIPRSRVGEIVLARVTAVRPELNAAFLDLGQGEAFLNLGKKKAPVEGELLPVAVTTDAAGRKQAQVTRQIALPGRFMSLLPTETDLAISGAIKAKSVREELKGLLAPGRPDDIGLLIHPNAADAGKIRLLSDLGALLTEWKAVEDALRAGDGPKVIRTAPSLEESITRLFPAATVEESSDGAGFESADIESQLANALAARRRLANGAVLSFDETEALVAIDVDIAGAARAPKGWGRLFEEMTTGIAAEIRLRRLAGIVLIDFPRLPKNEGRDGIAAAMRTAFDGWPRSGNPQDPGPQVLGWSQSGLLEITVPRLGRSLRETYLRPASAKPRAASIGLGALRRLVRETSSIAHPELLCAPDVAEWLQNGPGKTALEETKSRLGGFLRITAQADYPLERLEIGPARR